MNWHRQKGTSQPPLQTTHQDLGHKLPQAHGLHVEGLSQVHFPPGLRLHQAQLIATVGSGIDCEWRCLVVHGHARPRAQGHGPLGGQPLARICQADGVLAAGAKGLARPPGCIAGGQAAVSAEQELMPVVNPSQRCIIAHLCCSGV